MKVTYDVTVRVVVDVAAYAAEYDLEGSHPDDVRRLIRNDLMSVSLLPPLLAEFAAPTLELNTVTCVSEE